MKSLLQKIFSVKKQGFRTVVTILGLKIKLQLNVRQLNYVEVDIVDHCNLNCRACSHFCPLTPEHFMDVEEFKKDLEALVEKFPKIKQFRLLGGEPLLHPDLIKFMKYTRALLPFSDIRIVSNGILVSKMSDEFFESVKKYGIIIDLSKYPVAGEKFSKALDKIGEKDAGLGFIHLAGKFWLSLVSDGSSDMRQVFTECTHKNCTSLRNGKLYVCPTGEFIGRYNKYFNVNIPEESGISVYGNSTEEIEKYLNTPFETCKYCLPAKSFKFVDWQVSKKDKDEWFADKV